MRETFLLRMPEFGDFHDRPSPYWETERAYKADFSNLCQNALTPALFPATMTPVAAQGVVDAVSQVLRQRLESIRAPQNLIGWRYSDFLTRMTEEEKARFARAFGDLLFGAGDSPERVGRFTKVVWPIWQRVENGNPYALSRIFPTTFLAMHSPARDVAVRTDLFSRASRALLGRSILRFEPFGADDYRSVLGFAHAVRAQLAAWAWRPRDMIDVHSFLWVATRSEYQASSSADEDPSDDLAEVI